MAYAWSQKGISYIASTRGKTVRHEENYRSKFENEYGNVEVKELSRPAIAHMLYEFLPLIDEHNRQRQGILSMERSWPTKNPWTRIMTTLIGMAVVDVQRWDRNMRSKYNEENSVHQNGDEDFSIMEMANYITVPLKTGSIKYRDGPRPSMRQPIADTGAPLQRIRGEDGTCATLDTKEGRTRVRQRSCFICRSYVGKKLILSGRAQNVICLSVR
jgi:hypothetical protein